MSGTKTNPYNGNNAAYRVVSADKQTTFNSKKGKSVSGKERTVPPASSPIMNHVTGQLRKNEDNPQNNQNDVEEMDTQEGEPTFHKG